MRRSGKGGMRQEMFFTLREITMTVQEVKKLFFTYRNGIIADALRKAGMPYKVIFGLQVPQLAAIAREIGHDAALAGALWQERTVRESRLLACYLFPPEETTLEQCVALAKDFLTREEADLLSFRLLKRLPYAPELLRRFASDPDIPSFTHPALAAHLL